MIKVRKFGEKKDFIFPYHCYAELLFPTGNQKIIAKDVAAEIHALRSLYCQILDILTNQIKISFMHLLITK